MASPHHFTYLPGFCCVNEDKVPVLRHYSYHTSQKIQLNHYYYKSFADFTLKIERGLATQARTGERTKDDKAFEDFARQAILPGEYDDAILRLPAAQPIHVPPAALKTGLLREAYTDFSGFSHAVAVHLETFDLDEALATLRTCLRYHDTAPSWLMAAKLHMANGDKEKSLRYIAKTLHLPDSPFRARAYACLAEYYRKFGEPHKAERIEAELRGTP